MEVFVAASSLPVNNTFLKTFEENQLFTNKNVSTLQPITSFIKTKLQTEKTRYEGLLYLKIYLQQCSPDIITENILIWISQCVNASGSKNSSVAVLGFELLKSLLTIARHLPDVSKNSLIEQVNKALMCIISAQQDAAIAHAALACLETCLSEYNGVCAQRRDVLNNMLLSYVDNSAVTLVKRAARCMHLMQQVIGGGQQGINHKTLWKQQLNSLCDTLHTILNILYENVKSAHLNEDDLKPLKLRTLHTDGTSIVSITQKLTLRFCNIVHFIDNMLRTSYPGIKPINVDLILSVITRGLSVNIFSFKHASLENAAIQAVIPVLHEHLFNLLTALNVCLGSNIIQFTPIICRCLTKEFLWMKKGDNSTAYKNLKLSMYRMLSSLLTVSQTASGIELYIDDLLPNLMADVTPPRQDVTLTVLSQTTKNLSKKARKKMSQLTAQNSTIGQTYSPTSQNVFNLNGKRAEQICENALATLTSLIQSIGPFLEANKHKSLQEFVVKTILDVHRGFSSKLYSNRDCLLGLYKLLMALIQSPNPDEPPPLQYGLHIFSKSQFDRDVKLSEFSQQALQQLEKLVHPALATLHFPIDISMRIADQVNSMRDDTQIDTVFDENEKLNENDEEQCENESTSSQVLCLESSDEETQAINDNEEEQHEDTTPIIDITASPEPYDLDMAALREIDKIDELNKSSSTSPDSFSVPTPTPPYNCDDINLNKTEIKITDSDLDPPQPAQILNLSEENTGDSKCGEAIITIPDDPAEGNPDSLENVLKITDGKLPDTNGEMKPVANGNSEKRPYEKVSESSQEYIDTNGKDDLMEIDEDPIKKKIKLSDDIDVDTALMLSSFQNVVE